MEIYYQLLPYLILKFFYCSSDAVVKVLSKIMPYYSDRESPISPRSGNGVVSLRFSGYVS